MYHWVLSSLTCYRRNPVVTNAISVIRYWWLWWIRWLKWHYHVQNITGALYSKWQNTKHRQAVAGLVTKGRPNRTVFRLRNTSDDATDTHSFSGLTWVSQLSFYSPLLFQTCASSRNKPKHFTFSLENVKNVLLRPVMGRRLEGK